jgi:hypothetical protein
VSARGLAAAARAQLALMSLHLRLQSIAVHHASRLRYWHLREWLYDLLVYRLAARILQRIATRPMRHAALLLGYDLAHGYHSGGLLSLLEEYSVGNEIAFMVLFATSTDEAMAGAASWRLERDALVGRNAGVGVNAQ